MSSFFNIFSPQKNNIISIVGAGGKTTIMFELANQLKRMGYRVLVTTTTRIYPPNMDQYDQLHYVNDSMDFSILPCSITVCASHLDHGSGKIIGLSLDQVKMLANRFDIVIIEADGAKKKPLKIPAAHEPVIYQESNIVLGVIGLSSYKQILDESTVHRYHLFSERLKIPEKSIINLKTYQNLILHTEGLFKNTPSGCKKVCIFNQFDLLDAPDEFIQKLRIKRQIFKFLDAVFVSKRKNNTIDLRQVKAF